MNNRISKVLCALGTHSWKLIRIQDRKSFYAQNFTLETCTRYETCSRCGTTRILHNAAIPREARF